MKNLTFIIILLVAGIGVSSAANVVQMNGQFRYTGKGVQCAAGASATLTVTPGPTKCTGSISLTRQVADCSDGSRLPGVNGYTYNNFVVDNLGNVSFGDYSGFAYGTTTIDVKRSDGYEYILAGPTNSTACKYGAINLL